MDTGPTETLYGMPGNAMTGGHFPLGELGLGEFIPSKSYRVAVFHSIFDKARGKNS
jgi:hypothetical protein